MDFELLAGDELVATLRFRSAFGTFATAESEDGCWTFKRVGFLQTRVTVRAWGKDTDIAVFRHNTWRDGGTLELPDGHKFQATTNFWQTQYEFQTEAGEPLIRFRQGGVIRASAQVEIQPKAIKLPELPWMVMLGWYLAVMMRMDSASSAGVTAAVV